MSAERVLRAAALLAVAASAPLASATAPAGARPAGAHLARTHPRASVASAGPVVSAMVVGAGNIVLVRPTNVRVPAATVRTSHGDCGVAEGTPLGVLVALNRTAGLSFALRDYGRCTGSPSGSGELFVSSLDGETNHGQNGWEYKVNSRSGTTGAADPTGPFGTGHRIASGSKVLWFWCESFGCGCQRTLELGVPASVSRGASFTVRVTGYDNDGNGKPMSGATVSLPGSSAVTGSSGTATLHAPSRAGLVSVRASRPGSVPAFPAAVNVR